MTKLRKFSLSDLDQVIKIEGISFPNRKSWSREYFKKFYQKYPRGFIVAENESEVMGYAVGKPKNDEAEIISLAINPNFRQQGIGAELANFLLEHFKKKGTRKISLRVRTKNKLGIAFYRKAGFEISKKIKNYYQNGDDAYLMRKKI